MHILAISTGPRNDFYRRKLCRLSCTLATATPTKILLSGGGQFLSLQNPYAEIRKFLTGNAPAHRFTPVFSNKVEIGAGQCPKGRVVLVTDKHKTRFGAV